MVCVTASVLGLACGSDDQPKREVRVEPTVPGVRHLVTDEQIGAAAKNSPARAVLLWFQAVQFKDQATVRELVTSDVVRDIGPDRLSRAVDTVGSSLGKPQVTSVRDRGSNASVRVFVLAYETGKPDPVAATPVTFSLDKDQGHWRLSDLRYLLTSADAISAAEADRSK